MAYTYLDYQVDPFNSDAPDYTNIQTDYYGGSYPNITTDASVNFPPSAPTRLFLTVPYIIDVSDLTGARPILVRNVTNSVNLTRVTAAPGATEFRVSPGTSGRRTVIELHSSLVSKAIGLDFWTVGGLLRNDDFNSIDISGTVTSGGGVTAGNDIITTEDLKIGNSKYIGVTSDTDLLQLASNSITGNGALNITNTTGSSSTTTGSIKTAGGLGVVEDIYAGGNLVVGGSATVTGVVNANGSRLASEYLWIEHGGSGHASSIFVAEDDPLGASTPFLEIVCDEIFSASAIRVIINGEECFTVDRANRLTISELKIKSSQEGMINKRASANCSGTSPSDAIMDAAFGTPATVGAGFFAFLSDSSSTSLMHLCTSDGTRWYSANLVLRT